MKSYCVLIREKLHHHLFIFRTEALFWLVRWKLWLTVSSSSLDKQLFVCFVPLFHFLFPAAKKDFLFCQFPFVCPLRKLKIKNELKLLTSESILIYNNLLDLVALIIEEVLQFHLGGVVGVRAENHAAVLPVKREVRHLWDVKCKRAVHIGCNIRLTVPLWSRSCGRWLEEASWPSRRCKPGRWRTRPRQTGRHYWE